MPEASGPVGGDEGGVIEVTDAFAAARGLLEGAEAEAERIVAEATQRARTREQEAQLLVAKARRVLAVAEDKAAAIVAVARSRADALVVAQAGAPNGGMLDGQAPAATSARPVPGGAVPASTGASSLDRILAEAIASAVDQTLDPEGVFRS